MKCGERSVEITRSKSELLRIGGAVQCSAQQERKKKKKRRGFDLRHGSDFTGRSRSGGSGSGPLQYSTS